MNKNKIISGRSKGVQPIRKRGYYRAKEKGEFWAVYKNSMDNMRTSFCLEFWDTYNRTEPLDIVGLTDIIKRNET